MRALLDDGNLRIIAEDEREAARLRDLLVRGNGHLIMESFTQADRGVATILLCPPSRREVPLLAGGKRP